MKDKRSKKPIHLVSSSTQSVSEDETETHSLTWEKFLYEDPGIKNNSENDAIGYGIERCLYELNPEMACLSPCLIHASVLTPPEALVALEAVAAQPNRPAFPVDRHLAAFLMSRWKEMNFLDLRDLGKPQREVKNLAVLRILAGIQNHFRVKELPNLCQWMAQICAPIVTHYHNLKARAEVQDEIAKAVSSGQLIKLVKALENRQALSNDSSDYQAAKIEVLLIESEIKEIELKILNRNRYAPQSTTGILGRVTTFLYRVKNAPSSRKCKHRVAQLYQKSETLRETWGEGLVPRGKNKPQDMFGKLWTKMNGAGAPKSPFKKFVDAPLKYD